mgnify:CR=1 FL=1
MSSTIKVSVTKLLLLIYLVYSQITAVLWFSIPRLSFLILTATYLSTFLFASVNRKRLVRVIIPWLILSGWFVTGITVALNVGIVINQTISFISGILLISIIYCVVEEEKSISSIVNIYLAFALIITVLTLANGVNFNRYASILRMSYSENVNSNEVGYILTLGIWCSLFRICDQNRGSIRNVIMSLLLSGVMFYTVLLTNSRKSIVGVMLISGLWLLLCYRGAWKQLKLYKKTIVAVLIMPMFFLGVRYIQTDILLNTSNYRERLSGLLVDGDAMRTVLIKDALSVFMDHPITGVGLNNYQYYSIFQMYSHSDYVEIFACAGLIGAVLYFAVHFTMGKRLVKYRRLFLREKRNVYYSICILFGFLLYIGIGRIHMYEDNSMYTFGIIIAFATSIFSDLRRSMYNGPSK